MQASVAPPPKPVVPEPATKQQEPRRRRRRPEPTNRPGRSRGPLLPMPTGLQPKLTAGGYVFPVYGPLVSFGDSFGAFRGDVAGNWHHGDDIFAPLGAPLLACADGTVFSVGWNDVGGNRLWLRDSQGNEFYYAHLSAFIAAGQERAPREGGRGARLRRQHRRRPGNADAPALRGAPVLAALHGLRRRGQPDLVPGAWKHLQDVRFSRTSAAGCRRDRRPGAAARPRSCSRSPTSRRRAGSTPARCSAQWPPRARGTEGQLARSLGLGLRAPSPRTPAGLRA